MSHNPPFSTRLPPPLPSPLPENSIPLQSLGPSIPSSNSSSPPASTNPQVSVPTNPSSLSHPPLILGIGPRWLHYHPSSPTSSSSSSSSLHVSLSPFNRPVQDRNPDWQWLILRWTPPPGTPAPIIPPMPPLDGTIVLVALANPRWYLGAKPTGNMFLLNTPTTMTLWTIKIPPRGGPNDFCLISSHGSWISATSSSIAVVPSPDLSGPIPRNLVLHAHRIPPHILTGKPTPIPSRIRHDRSRSPPIGRPHNPPPPPSIIESPIALISQLFKRVVCKRPIQTKRLSVVNPIGLARPISNDLTIPRRNNESDESEPMQYYLGKTTKKQIDKQTKELIAFFHIHFAEPKFAPVSPVTSDESIIKPGASGTFPTVATAANYETKNSIHLPSPVKLSPPKPLSKNDGPVQGNQSHRTPVGWIPGAPLDVAKADGHLVLLIAADTGAYLGMETDGTLIDLSSAMGDGSTCPALWTYHRLPSSPLALALMHVATGLYVTIDESFVGGIRIPRMMNSISINKKTSKKCKDNLKSTINLSPTMEPPVGSALLTANQTLRLYVPASLPQAVNSLHARSPPGRMLVFSVALACTSLVSASAAIANVLIRANVVTPSSSSSSSSHLLTNASNPPITEYQPDSSIFAMLNAGPDDSNMGVILDPLASMNNHQHQHLTTITEQSIINDNNQGHLQDNDVGLPLGSDMFPLPNDHQDVHTQIMNNLNTEELPGFGTPLPNNNDELSFHFSTDDFMHNSIPMDDNNDSNHMSMSILVDDHILHSNWFDPSPHFHDSNIQDCSLHLSM